MSTKQKKWTAVISVASILTLSLGAFAACGGEEHTLTPVDAKQPTCTEAGNEAYYLCSHCGKLFADENAETEVSDADVTLAALGHELTHHDAVAATCTENGNIEYWSCSRCELNFSDAEATKQVGSVTTTASHDIVLVDTVEPTAESEGVKEHYECTVCKTYFADPYGEEEADKEDYVLDKLVSQSVSITVEIYDLSGALIEDAAAYEEISGELALVGSYSTNTYENLTVNADRSLGVDSLCVGSYQIDADGFRRASFEVTAGTTDYTLRLEETIAYGSNDNVTVNDSEGTISFAAQDMQNNAWTGSAELILPEDLGNDTFVFDSTLKMGDYNAGWSTESTQQRYAIKLLSNNVGFYFWSWDSSGYKSHIRLFATNNLNNAMAENADVNADEAALGFMTESLLGEEGLQLRIFRTSTEFALFAWNGTEWTHLGSIDISSYGEIPARIVLYGAQASYVWSDIGIQTLTHVAASEPSAEKPGNHAYYTDGTRYWFEDFEETTAEDVMIYMPVSVTLNLSAIALDGKTAAQIPEGTVITLTGRSNVYTYTVGESDVLNMIAGSYTVSADGYRTIQLTVPATGGELNVALTQVIALQGSVEDYTSKKWSDSATLEIGQNIADSTAVILEFTIKNVTNSQAGWPTEEWASQRLAIQMAAGNEGFLFFLPKGEANIFDMTDNTISDSGKTRFGESGAIYAWIDTLMRTENGVQMRLVRTGENVTLYVLNESAQWVKIGTVACADAQTEIIFYGCGVTWEFSSVTVDELTYVAEKQPTASEQGNVAYYTDGTNYWFEDGSQTTAEDVVINAVSVSLSFSATELDGSKPASLADGTVITLTGKFNTYTYTVGGAALTQMYADTYTVTADGYATATLVVPEEGGELTVTLHKALTIGKGAVALTNNAWAGQEKLTVPDGLTTGDFVFEATLNMRDFLSGWDTIQTQQRYAIRLTEGNVGFYFWSWNSGGTRTYIRQFGENNLTNAMAENADVNGDEAGLGYIVDELLSDEGLRIRITRTGTTFKLEVMNGDAWAELGSVTCAEGDAADIELYAGAGTYVWSNITINPV